MTAFSPLTGMEHVSSLAPTGTHTIYLLQRFFPHLGAGEELIAFRFANLEQGGHGAYAYTAHGCSPLAVRVSSQSQASLVASDVSGNLPLLT